LAIDSKDVDALNNKGVALGHTGAIEYYDKASAIKTVWSVTGKAL